MTAKKTKKTPEKTPGEAVAKANGKPEVGTKRVGHNGSMNLQTGNPGNKGGTGRPKEAFKTDR